MHRVEGVLRGRGDERLVLTVCLIMRVLDRTLGGVRAFGHPRPDLGRERSVLPLVRHVAANTATTVITFLMVFILQHTQNRDSLATHVKLDGIIKAIEGVDNRLLIAEDESEERLRQEIVALRGEDG
jgi:hypothetical protein